MKSKHTLSSVFISIIACPIADFTIIYADLRSIAPLFMPHEKDI